MRVGLLARGEDRGLGTMTREWFRNMRPERTLLIVPEGIAQAGLVTHNEWYPECMQVLYGIFHEDGTTGMVDEATCRGLSGLDVVYSAETFYDWRFCQWAKEMGVATVCHAMPEFYRNDWDGLPTRWWAPTTYRVGHLAPNTRVVPVPIPTDRWPNPRTVGGGDRLRWLHIAGAQTFRDRNGTDALFRAAGQLTRPTTIAVTAQTDREFPNISHWVTVDKVDGPDDYWALYDGIDALVLPRRYAGLCLPVLEAMGAGVPVVMTDLAPQNEDWPVALVPSYPNVGSVALPGGLIELGDIDTIALAGLMDSWEKDHQLAVRQAERQQPWVEANSWEAMRPMIEKELCMVVEGR